MELTTGRPATNFRRASYLFLCASPFLAMALAAIRPLRVPGVHQTIGGAVFAAMAFAVWTLGGRAIRGHATEGRLAALAGTLLVLPFSLIALLWVGVGPPWEASAVDNQMRYIVLVSAAAAVGGGCIALREALNAAGERFYSTLGFASIILAGPLYLVGETLLLAAYSAKVRSGQVAPVFVSLSEWQDILLFFGGVLTYAATAAFAVSLAQAGWLGRAGSRIFAGVSLVGLVCLVIRGLQFPDPAALSAPWYTMPGLITGIPGVPFIIPCLLGVVSLRRASREEPSKPAEPMTR